MRAVRVHELTGPSALRVDDVADPKPAAGQVLIDVKAAGVNFPDVLLSRGLYQFKPSLPFSPGGECAGIVRELGDGVTGVAVGDRVAATTVNGSFAEKICLPAATVMKLPDGVGFEVGAATLLTYATTYHALVDRAVVAPGEKLLVLGAAGGVGLAAIEIGKILGARVIACASSADKLAVCTQHGADETINYAVEDLRERMKTLTGGAGPDVVYDPVGGSYTELALRSIAWRGRLLVVGFAAGDIPKMPLNLTLLKGCSIVGVFWGDYARREPRHFAASMERLAGWHADGRLRPHISATFPLERAADALRLMAARKVMGKVVLTVD
jgi:NADPH:quinone reductase